MGDTIDSLSIAFSAPEASIHITPEDAICID